jgi:predicted lipoprotein with Yx(FWY)xxD motif
MRTSIRDRILWPFARQILIVCTLLAAPMIAGCTWISGMRGTVPVRVENGSMVNPDGMTLYVFDRDRAAGSGRSVCLGQCAANWPPLAAAEDASQSGDYGIIVRDDGKKQWTYKGRPLYLWVKDRKPGDRTGDNLNKVWHVAKP